MGYKISYSKTRSRGYRYRLYVLSFLTGIIFRSCLFYSGYREFSAERMYLFPDKSIETFAEDISRKKACIDNIREYIDEWIR